jgi:uncharacterized membrane protein
MNRLNIWIILLLVSVLLNGVLLGAGARSWFAPEASLEARETVRPGGGFQLRAFVAALPAEERRAARQRLESTRRELGGLVREAARSRRAAAQALLADPFDPEAAEAALDRSREARAALEDATETLILEIAADLEPEERQAAFSAAMRVPPFDRRGAGMRERRPGPPPGW